MAIWVEEREWKEWGSGQKKRALERNVVNIHFIGV